MSSHPAPRKSRVRPEGQQAQVILRMSAEERAGLHAAAVAAGLPTARYLLALAADDSARRASVTEDAAATTLRNGEGPDPMGQDPLNARAEYAVRAATG